MAPLRTILCILAVTATAAFAPAHPHRRQVHSPLFSDSDKGGNAALASKTDVKTTTDQKTTTKSKTKSKAKTDSGGPSYGNPVDFEEPPMFNLFLVGDKEYEQEHVVKQVGSIVKGVSAEDALKIYKKAQKNDEALCGKFPKESAEFFAEQLTRSTPIIYATVKAEDAE